MVIIVIKDLEVHAIKVWGREPVLLAFEGSYRKGSIPKAPHRLGMPMGIEVLFGFRNHVLQLLRCLRGPALRVYTLPPVSPGGWCGPP